MSRSNLSRLPRYGLLLVAAGIALAALVSPLSFPESTYAAGSIVQLTSHSNGYWDVYPLIDAGQVAWQEDTHSDNLTFLYDGYRALQVSSGSHQNILGDIDRGQVVWSGFDSGNCWQIYMYNGNATVQLTNNTNPDYYNVVPKIDQGQVVWQAYTLNGEEGIFLYDGTSTRKLADGGWNPQINSGEVVWEAPMGAGIFLYDGTSVRQLSTSGSEPQISAGQVVWSDSGSIFLYDGHNTIQISQNAYTNFSPQIDDGQVTWFAYDGNTNFVFLYDGAKTIQLGNSGWIPPKIDAGQVAWIGADGQIYLYNGTDTIQLTHDAATVGPMLDIDSGCVVWNQWAGSDMVLFLYKPWNSVGVPTATSTGTATFSATSGTIDNLTAVNPATLPAPPVNNLVFPDGMFSFDITGVSPAGGTVTVTIQLPSGIPANAAYWKYDTTHGWSQIPYTVVSANQIAIALTDGGIGDSDGIANRTITDPGGLGGPGPSGGAHSAPVFPSIYIGIGAALGAGIVAYAVRRRLATR